MAVNRDKIIASAEKLVGKGKVEAAIKEYERLLDDNPNDVNTLNRIGDLWVRINRPEEAVRVFGRIADHYSKDGFFLKAIAIYKKINKLDPSRLDVYARLADLYAKQGLAMEAKSQYQTLADYYLRHGDPDNALQTFKKIAELDPNSINVHVKLADLYSQTNRTDEALKEYDRVGKMLVRRGMLDEALQVFRKALKIDPGNLEIVDSVVTSLLEAKDFTNASQILESAIAANRDPKLLALLGKTHLLGGDVYAARTVLDEGHRTHPDSAAIREMLSDVCLRQGQADRAFDLILPLVDSAVSRTDGRSAIDLLNRVLRADPNHIRTLEKVIGVYTRLREETNILAALNSLAEAHIAQKDFDQAASTLRDLIRREPENSQHKVKLNFVLQHSKPAEPATSPPLTAPPVVALPVPPAKTEAAPPRPAEQSEWTLPESEVEPPASFDASELFGAEPKFEAPVQGFDLSHDEFMIDLEEPSSIDLGGDFSFDLSTADEVSPITDPGVTEDLDFITEHLTEADVFAKYGLAEKALEHLRVVLDRAPKHLGAWDRLLRIQLDEGEPSAVLETTRQYLALLNVQGDSATARAVEQVVTARGFALPGGGIEEGTFSIASPVVEETTAEEIEFEIDLSDGEGAFAAEVEIAGEEVEFDLGTPGVEAEPEQVSESDIAAIDFTEVEFPEPIAPEPTGEAPDFAFPSFDNDVPIQVKPETDASEQLFFGVEASRFEGLDPELDEFLIPETPSSLEPAPEAEELGEIDFYLEQGDLEIAAGKIERLSARFPDHSEVVLRRDRLEVRRLEIGLLAEDMDLGTYSFPEPEPEPVPEPAAAAPPQPVPAPPEPTPPPAPPPVKVEPIAPGAQAVVPLGLSADDIENEILSALPSDDDDIHVTPSESAPHATIELGDLDEESLFADEDDFFDLAAELEEEFEEQQPEEVVTIADDEQTLEQIFREFKRGVEQQLDSEDYDTHYNLGIAYKEMGLIDEAIGEFQLAAKDPQRMIECCSMLGLCFIEKGMPQLAIKWYRKGLESPDISEDENLGLLYDLGASYVEVGDTDNALKSFMEIYGANTNYRDVVARIRELEDARP